MPSENYEWIPRVKSHETEAKSECLKSINSNDNHPLMDSKAQKNEPVNTISADPLSLDPLSQMVVEVSIKEKLLKEEAQRTSLEPWSLKRSSILAKYTTNEKLSLTTSFLVPIDKSKIVFNTTSTLSTTTTTVSDKIKQRLEQLDQFDDTDNMQQMINLSQQEYTRSVDELNNALLQAWNEDERVKALKIVIQCAKLLADTSVIQFYPSKFVLITDVLDTFGKLVYERIRTKSVYTPMSGLTSRPQPLPEKFSVDMVPASAKETCRNWFLKIASIRELLPRIYVETSILKCQSYLSDNNYAINLKRLIAMTSGIGDPLVSAYARCYILRVGVSCDKSLKDYQSIALNDMLFVLNQLTPEYLLKYNQKIDFKAYIELYCPALDWLLQCTFDRQTQEFINKFIENLKETSNDCASGLLINSMISSLEPKYVCNSIQLFINMIKKCNQDYFPSYLLFRNLGMCLLLNDSSNRSSNKKEELQYLNEVWKIVAKFVHLEHYISCAEIWIEFTLKNFTRKEVNTLIGDIIQHLLPNRGFEQFYAQLQSIVSKILIHIDDFNLLFSMDNFLKFLDLFQKDSIKLDACKSVCYAFLRNDKNNQIKDNVIIVNSMMQICKSMHDYVDALTLEDERREITHLICSFINRVQLSGKEQIEQYLNFCSDARSTFSNLDGVIALLVHKVNHLSTQVLQIVNYNHTKKTAAFVRACLAYSFITIPSLQNPFTKLKLYLEASQVATLNQCLSQADAFLKAAITLIPDVPKIIDSFNSIESLNLTSNRINRAQIETYLYDYLTNILSTLVLIPDNPDQGVLYLFNGISNLIRKHFEWENNDIKLNLIINCLCLLNSLKQESHAYHVPNVESNDSLYGSDPKYFKEITQLITDLIDEIFSIIIVLTQEKQSKYALDLFNRLISFGDLSNDACLYLATKLWNLSLKHDDTLSKLHKQLKATIDKRALNHYEFKQLKNKLKL